MESVEEEIITNHEKTIPIDHQGWDGDMDCLMFYDPVFYEDWGPWKKGDTFSMVTLDFNKRSVTVFDERGRDLKEVKFVLQPQP